MTTPNALPQIGFIGTGNIGQPIIRSMLRAGYPVAVWNRTPARYADLVAAGATATATPRELAAKSDILCAMLVEAAHLDALLDGSDGILAGVNDHGLGRDCPDSAVAQETIDRWDIA